MLSLIEGVEQKKRFLQGLRGSQIRNEEMKGGETVHAKDFNLCSKSQIRSFICFLFF